MACSVTLTTCPAVTSASVGTQRRVLWTRTDPVLEDLLDIPGRHWKGCQCQAAKRKGRCSPSGQTFSIRTEDDEGGADDTDMTANESNKESAEEAGSSYGSHKDSLLS